MLDIENAEIEEAERLADMAKELARENPSNQDMRSGPGRAAILIELRLYAKALSVSIMAASGRSIVSRKGREIIERHRRDCRPVRLLPEPTIQTQLERSQEIFEADLARLLRGAGPALALKKATLQKTALAAGDRSRARAARDPGRTTARDHLSMSVSLSEAGDAPDRSVGGKIISGAVPPKHPIGSLLFTRFCRRQL